jgi:hypothetical protein
MTFAEPSTTASSARADRNPFLVFKSFESMQANPNGIVDSALSIELGQVSPPNRKSLQVLQPAGSN